MEGSQTIRMSKPPELSEYSIKEDTSSSSSSEIYDVPQIEQKPSSSNLHGFGNKLGLSRTRSSPSAYEHRGWGLFRKERTPTPGTDLQPEESKPQDIKEVSWWRRTMHRSSRAGSISAENASLHDVAITPEENMVLKANEKLDAKVRNAFENMLENKSGSKEQDMTETDSDDDDEDSLVEASRIIKSRMEDTEGDSPETPPNESIMKVHFKPPNNETSIYDYIYESPNAKNSKNIDFMAVDLNSVTFGKFQRIISCMNGNVEKIKGEQSLVAVCDYILTLCKRCQGEIADLESNVMNKGSDCSHTEELEKLEAKVRDVTERYEHCSSELDRFKGENSNLKSKLEEVIKFNNMCKQFFEEYRDQISVLYKQINMETTKNEGLVQKQEKISKEYESERSRNLELSQNLSITQEILKDVEARYLELIEKFTGKDDTTELTCLEAKVSSLNETICKLTKGNNRLVSDCHRERKKVLDLRKQTKLNRKYTDAVLTFQNGAVQFITQFLVSFRNILDPNQLVHLQERLHIISSFNPLEHGSLEYDTEKDLVSDLKAFERDTYDVFMQLINCVLAIVLKKFTEEQNSNSFLTTQLSALRKESMDKDEYIQSILHDTNRLKVKLKKV